MTFEITLLALGVAIGIVGAVAGSLLGLIGVLPCLAALLLQDRRLR